MSTATAIALATAMAMAVVAGQSAFAGDVRGQIKIKGKLDEAPKRGQGFVPRIRNLLRPAKTFDPRPYMVVVLEGGPVAEDAATPRKRTYRLVGESFATPLLAVVAESRVEIRNDAFEPAVLTTPGYPNLIDEVKLQPGDSTKIEVSTPPYTMFAVKSATSPTPRGEIVAFPNRYFAKVDRRGRFAITKVPDGTWKARLWYRGNWVEGAETKVVVTRRRSDIVVSVKAKELETPATQ